MSKSPPSRRKQSRSTPRPKPRPLLKSPHFTNAELRLLDALANKDWPTRPEPILRALLRGIAFKVAQLIEVPRQAQRAKAARRKDIDENIRAFES